MSAKYPHDRFLRTRISSDSFWGRWQTVARQVTLPVQLDLLKQTGRYDAFNLKPLDYYNTPYTVWPVPDWLFWESDVAKWIEGVCYFLHFHPNAELSAHVQYLVNLIESAQQPDGYLNIHFVVNEPNKRWSNLRDLHELYNGGHLIEAALAHHQLTGSEQFLNVMLRFVHYCARVFGPVSKGLRAGYPGHPEIELALLRLYSRTGDQASYTLARFFLTERGANGGQYYIDEQAARGEHPELAPAMMPKKHSFWYMQAHKPIAEQDQIEGHSVRAGYLLTAVADLISMEEEGKAEPTIAALSSALSRLWTSMVDTKMYVTGGIGSVRQWEGFSIPYSLPQGTDEGGCYAETCAAISVIMVAERMLSMKLDSQVADVAERALYNASLTCGMSTDGRSFTYENQLATSPQDACTRHSWFQCACCPPNVLRTLGALGGYFWSFREGQGLAIHHYFEGHIEFGDVTVTMRTRYPWEGGIDLHIKGEDARVWLRIPAWASNDYQLSSQPIAPASNGYICLGPGQHTVELAMKPRIAYSHPHTGQDTLTLLRGPLVYCLEDIDHPWETNHFKDLCVSPSDLDVSRIQVDARDDGITYLLAPSAGYHLRFDAHAPANEAASPTNRYLEADGHGKDLTFVPFYYRANRRKEGVQVRTSLRHKR